MPWLIHTLFCFGRSIPFLLHWKDMDQTKQKRVWTTKTSLTVYAVCIKQWKESMIPWNYSPKNSIIDRPVCRWMTQRHKVHVLQDCKYGQVDFFPILCTEHIHNMPICTFYAWISKKKCANKVGRKQHRYE